MSQKVDRNSVFHRGGEESSISIASLCSPSNSPVTAGGIHAPATPCASDRGSFRQCSTRLKCRQQDPGSGAGEDVFEDTCTNIPSAGTYEHCRKFLFSTVTNERQDMVICRYSACHEGFITFEVVDIVKLCREMMRERESTLKGKWLTTIKEAHSHACEYLISAVCKKPGAARGAGSKDLKLKGKFLTYSRDKKQRKAWEAFKEFLKR